MNKQDILLHNFTIGGRLHKYESMPYWCKIIMINNKLFGIDGNGVERLQWTYDSYNKFNKEGVYRVEYPIWCYDCEEYADVYCAEFHSFSNGWTNIICGIDDYFNAT